MEVSKINNSNQQAFKAKFTNNKAFREVVTYAKEQGRLQELNTALTNLSIANRGEITLLHLDAGKGIVSNFTFLNGLTGVKSSVANLSMQATSAVESSFNAILDLGTLGRRFRKLVKGDVKLYISENDILNKYTLPKKI